MTNNIKRYIVFSLIIATVLVAPLSVAWGVYFGVLTNLTINAFWNSKLFPAKQQSKSQLLTENVLPPRL
jgi:hypothetical protein|tara:strand:- start:722 stop:928 length:207 start_codon:yes stop_codon:yes gene_type:complete